MLGLAGERRQSGTSEPEQSMQVSYKFFILAVNMAFTAINILSFAARYLLHIKSH